jgi:hypothetical protein
VFVRRSVFNKLVEELDEAAAEILLLELLLSQATKELAEVRLASAKKRHPASPKKTTTKKVEKNGK